jgi:hypothetical protein
MLPYPIARARALRRAVLTGQLAEMDFIHAIQAAEGSQTCFGRAEADCKQADCRWHDECMALAELSPFAPEPALA